MPEPARSHLWPRTRRGRIAVIAFLALFALTQWPVLPWLNRVEPTVFGVPFLFAALLMIYLAMIGVLIWAARHEL